MNLRDIERPVRIELTEAQKAQIRRALTDGDFELEVTEMEERIAPRARLESQRRRSLKPA
jgi:hypothetical protein